MTVGGIRAELRARSRELWIAGALLLLVLGVYSPVRHFGFVDYDDSLYVLGNAHVTSGLSAQNLRWAFTSTEAANWVPFTWISLMADRQFFAPQEELARDVGAGPFHWTNVMLHAAGTLLLFGLLLRTTGASGPSAWVAFLFALHPQHVESVAWVSERKDVLSGVLWMLALWSYVRYASRPRIATYLPVVLLYCLGFMAKPMVVTLPLVLILLDVWPLQRVPVPAAAGGVRGQLVRWRLWEKLPFFVLALAMSVTTYAVQKHGGAVRTLTEVPPGARLGNAVISAAVYIGKTLWPTRLAVLYPLPPKLAAWQAMAAGLLLAGITVLAIGLIRTRPYLAAGWFWYLITLLPVIGIVQVGEQARADRYTYIPTIGLSLMLAWSGADAWRRWPKARPALAGIGGAACLACVVLTARQIPVWKDSVSLFQHTIEVTGPNPIAHGLLAATWSRQVMFDAAIAEYRQGLAIEPRNVAMLVDLGALLGRTGRMAEAIASFSAAVRLQPRDPIVRNGLGEALALAGRPQEALPQIQEAIRLRPDFAAAHAALGKVLQSLGRSDEAVAQFSEAVRIEPENLEARRYLDAALALRGQAGKE